MKIAVAVVVGVAMLGAVGAARADDSKSTRNEVCLETCNFAFEKCQEREGSKGARAGQCNIEVVRCKNACPQAEPEDTSVPTVKSHAKCVDRCRAAYTACLAKPENKHGGTCAADDMRCEQACPAPPPPAGAAVQAAGEPGPDGTVAAPRVAPAEPKKPRRAARVEGAAAPAPASATPTAAVAEPPPVVKSEALAPPVEAPAPATAAARPAQEKRGFFATLGCFFVSCEPEGSSPCLQECATAYDECLARESKRGGECNTRLMHCRQGCGSAPDAAAR